MTIGLIMLLDLLAVMTSGHHLIVISDIIGYIITAALAMLAIYALYRYILFREVVSKKIELITSAIFDIVRDVENCSASGWRNAVRMDSDLTARFAIEGPERIISASNLIASYDGLNPTDTLTAAGEKLANYQQTRRSSFLRGRGFTRNAISIVYSLLEMRNYNAAFRSLIHYMSEQARSNDGSAPNYPHLKMFFDLPDTWPNDNDVSEAMKRRLSRWDEFVIGRVLHRGRRKIEAALAFHPATPDGEPEIEIRGKATLTAFRKFLHASLEDLYASSTRDFR
jgi:hypothetical protein